MYAPGGPASNGELQTRLTYRYTLPASDVRPAVARSSGGVVLSPGGLSLAATATWVTPEFADGRARCWGQPGVTMAW